jgi:hypothetical protein
MNSKITLVLDLGSVDPVHTRPMAALKTIMIMRI